MTGIGASRQEEWGKTLMDRDQARTDYRRILAGVVRHHQGRSTVTSLGPQ
ncbi:hypothetical protein N826_31555 [Skermanella aerolata KACC 11604]|nr:hypothetical protein N826_31555 [Skermanella aerolata KACC 11604]